MVQAGHHRSTEELTANDFRFTTKGDTVFAFICGEPKGEVKIKEFNKLKYHTIQSVSMLGLKDDLKFSQEKDGLVVQMPETLPSKNAVCLGDVPAAVEFGRVAAAPVNTLRQQTHRCQEISVCF